MLELSDEAADRLLAGLRTEGFAVPEELGETAARTALRRALTAGGASLGVRWDAAAGAGYLPLSAGAAGSATAQRSVANPVEGRGEVVLDFDAAGRVLGVEFLDELTLPPGASRS